jgi:adenosine deaminase
LIFITPPKYKTFIILLAFLVPALAFAQQEPHKRAQPASHVSISAEARAGKAFDAARENPLALYAFLVRMPKGADLHNHLTGAVYAESWIREAAEDNMCVDAQTFALSKSAAGDPKTSPNPECGEGKIPAATSLHNQSLYDSMVDAFSMRAFIPTAGVSGHDHFFTAFSKFDAVDKKHTGEWLDEVASRAADQNEQYLELMVTPPHPHTTTLANAVEWKDDFAQLRADFLAQGMQDDIKAAKEYLDEAETIRKQREHCGEPSESTACRVKIRYVYQVLRGAKKERVFAQTLLGFEIAAADPRVVGINYVQPEDGYTAMADYSLQMRIVGFMHKTYPATHISLHAGELAPGLVPPDGLCCHIREAIEIAHAERIGHGVDVMYENDPDGLLSEMTKQHVMVEINLTSNDVILGVSGENQPLKIYRKHKVPVALSTDDEGVSRINLTHEFVRGAQSYELRYEDLKQIVRTSLEHSFLPGKSLWRETDNFESRVAACASDSSASARQSAACSAYLKSSEKAAQQWELERRFAVFESTF